MGRRLIGRRLSHLWKGASLRSSALVLDQQPALRTTKVVVIQNFDMYVCGLQSVIRCVGRGAPRVPLLLSKINVKN